MNNNIEQLVNALRACGIDARVSTTTSRGIDGKFHLCTFVFTDFFTGEEDLEFWFHPYTGKLVKSILDCPIQKK